MTASGHLVLGAMFRALGAFPSGWRYPGAHNDPLKDAAVLRRTARTAERAGLDYLFFGDWLSTGADLEPCDPYLLARIEPFTAATYLAGVTRRIGLIATANATYSDPYQVARATASLDLVSGGRAGLNLVAGAEPRAAGNHGHDEHWGDEHRYDRAEEFIAALRLLWDSWEDDAFVRDRASGRLIDPAKLHPAGFAGAHVRVAGALNVARPPQGHPPIVHAGTSVRSRRLAGRFADLALAAAPTAVESQAIAAELHAVADAAGRDRPLVITPVLPVVADDRGAAQRIFDDLLRLVPLDDGSGTLPAEFATGRGIRALSQAVGVALGPQPLDTAVPTRVAARFSEVGRRLVATVERRTGRRLGHTERPVTYRTLLATQAVPGAVVVGSPADIADHLEERFASGAVDGFNVLTAFHDGQFDAFAELVVPELVRRGLFRSEYEGRTLRENLGLQRPANLHTTGPQQLLRA